MIVGVGAVAEYAFFSLRGQYTLRRMENLISVPESSLLPLSPLAVTTAPQRIHIDARDRLIVALDLADTETAKKLVADLGDTVRFYKIGLSLQGAGGVHELINELIQSGKKVFLDYKYYDIPETLEKAVRRAAQRGISFLTIHGTKTALRLPSALAEIAP